MEDVALLSLFLKTEYIHSTVDAFLSASRGFNVH